MSTVLQRPEAYLKKLIGRKGVEESLQQLNQLTQECRMAAAGVLEIARDIDDRVMAVDLKVADVGDKVRDVVDKDKTVEDFNEGVQGVNMSISK